MLITADNALDTALALACRQYDSSEVKFVQFLAMQADGIFKNALRLLSDFAKEFPLKDPISDPNISGTAAEEVKNGNNSNSPTTILQALENDLHSNVKFPSISLSLNADGYQPMCYDCCDLTYGGSWGKSFGPRTIKFRILKSLHDPDPIFITVKCGCHTIDFASVSDSSAGDR